MNRVSIWYKSNLIIGLLILYYAVGMGLFLIQETRPLFQLLTPFSLVMTFGAVLVLQKEWSAKWLLAFLLVFGVSLAAEMIGVRTGALFGHYVYGKTLGLKLLETPLVIGLNWLLLIYCSAAIVNHTRLNKTGRIFLGAGLMVAYDLVLEYVAPVMDMWSWDGRYPGPRNFLMWFLLSLAFHTLFQQLGLVIQNKPARYLFGIQFLFFFGIAIYAYSML
jgi:putative membrane protein